MSNYSENITPENIVAENIAPENVAQETVRNRLLRRLDWRFLLPNPAPQRVLSFADGLLFDALAAFAPVCDRFSDTKGNNAGVVYDLAVAMNPRRTVLEAAFAQLSDEGVFYAEWYFPCNGGAAAIRRQLQAAGFEAVTCYWHWPLAIFTNPNFWLPLEASLAIDYFLASQPASKSVLKSMLRKFYRTIWRLCSKVGCVLPICTIAQKKRPGVHEAIAESAIGKAAESDWLLLTGGRRTINKVVRLVFAENETQPQSVVKFARVAESRESLAQEVATLNWVHAQSVDGMAGVPKVLFQQSEPGFMAIGETALLGVPIWTVLRNDNFHIYAHKATEWLIGLARQSKYGTQPKSPSGMSSAGISSPGISPSGILWKQRLITPVLQQFESDFGQIVGVQFLEQLFSEIAILDNLPLVCEQRDFSPWNVLIDAQDELIVLDWESAELQGVPLLDLVYFLTYLAFFCSNVMDSGKQRQVYGELLDPRSVLGGIFEQCCFAYASAVGVERRMLFALRLLTWLIHSQSEYKQMQADSAGKPERQTLEKSLFLGLLREEFAHYADHAQRDSDSTTPSKQDKYR